jgi:integrase
MQGYQRTLEDHVLPAFGERAMADISRGDIARWEKREKAIGYADASVKLWRKVLHLVLADAVEDEIIQSNPASRRRGWGKHNGRAPGRGEEKPITTALGVLLIAERAAPLSGRDDELVALLLKGFTGMRWGELLASRRSIFARTACAWIGNCTNWTAVSCTAAHQKDESRRTVYIPAWLHGLVSDHLAKKVGTALPMSRHEIHVQRQQGGEWRNPTAVDQGEGRCGACWRFRGHGVQLLQPSRAAR